MSLDHLHSAYLILATLAAGAAVGGLLYLVGFVGWVLDVVGGVVRWAVTTGFRVWAALLSWAEWRVAAPLAVLNFAAGLAAAGVDAPVFALPTSVVLIFAGVVTCLAYMYLSFERYEVARGYKAVHNPLKGQELAADLARFGPRVGVPLLVVAAVGTVLGFAQLNQALYETFGRDWFRLANEDETAGFLDFLAYALVHLLRVVDVLDLAQSYSFLSFSVVKPALWPAKGLLIAFKSFFTLVLLQQVFASVREGKLLAETVNDFWSPHAPIHERARFALPQFGPGALRPILRALVSLGPLTKEQRDRLPEVFASVGPVAVPELIRHADEPHESIRAVVAKALGLLRAPEAAGPLIALAADESEAVRAAAAEGLGLIAEAAARGRQPEVRPAVTRGKWRERVARLQAVTAADILHRIPIARRWVADRPSVHHIPEGEVVPACVAALRKAVDDPSAVVRSEAVAALGRVGTRAAEAATELVHALTADADETRRRAAVAVGLVRADAPIAIPALMAALQDATPTVRAAAANALAEYGPAAGEAVPTLVLLLQDRDEEVRTAAAAAVNRIGSLGEESTQVLVEGLGSTDNVVRAQTAEALGVIGGIAEEAAPSLVAALGDENDTVRAKAAEALGKIGEGVAEIAVPELVRALRDEDNWVRALAAEALGQMGEAAEDAAPALLRSLHHPNPLVRANAAEALGRLGADDARAALEAAAADDDPAVRAKALRALGELGPAESSAAVAVGCLRDPDPLVRATAVDAVGAWPGLTVDPDVFRALLDDGNDDVAARAIRLAPSLSQAEVALPGLRARLAGTPNPLVQLAAATALGRFGPSAADAEPELAAAAREGDSELREAAMRALALIQPPNAAGVFAAGLRDPEARIRKVASGGLMKVTAIPDDAVPAVVESLRDPDEQVRANAAHLLSLLDPVPAEAVPDLIACASPTAPDGLRLNAATALRRVPSADARAALRALLADPSPRVRLVAAGSLAVPAPAAPAGVLGQSGQLLAGLVGAKPAEPPPADGGPDDPAVRAVIADALHDTNPKIQAIARELVASLGLTEADFEPPEPAPEPPAEPEPMATAPTG